MLSSQKNFYQKMIGLLVLSFFASGIALANESDTSSLGNPNAASSSQPGSVSIPPKPAVWGDTGPGKLLAKGANFFGAYNSLGEFNQPQNITAGINGLNGQVMGNGFSVWNSNDKGTIPEDAPYITYRNTVDYFGLSPSQNDSLDSVLIMSDPTTNNRGVQLVSNQHGGRLQIFDAPLAPNTAPQSSIDLENGKVIANQAMIVTSRLEPVAVLGSLGNQLTELGNDKFFENANLQLGSFDGTNIRKTIILNANNKGSDLALYNASNDQLTTAHLYGDDNGGHLSLQDNAGIDAVVLNAGERSVSVQSNAGQTGVKIQSTDNGGMVAVNDTKGNDTVTIDGAQGKVTAKAYAITPNGSFDAGGVVMTNAGTPTGENGSDVVNVAYLKQVIANNQSGIAGQIKPLSDRMNIIENHVQNLQASVRQLQGGVAQSLASARLPQPRYANSTVIGAGVAYYKGAIGYALGASHRLENDRWEWNTAATFDNRHSVGISAGIGYEFH